MRPFIGSGRFVFIQRKERYNSGDVVFYSLRGQKYIHRIVKMNNNEVVVSDDCGITTPVRISCHDIVGICHTGLNGYCGFLYNFFTRWAFALRGKIQLSKL